MRLRALLVFAERLTSHAGSDHGPQVRALTQLGWSAAAIHDTVQIIAYFNYVNRLAEGLGIELEARWAASD